MITDDLTNPLVIKGFPGGSEVKASACNAATWVRSLGREYPLEKEKATHSSILENPMDGGAWWATVHRVRKELDTTEQLHFHFSNKNLYTSSQYVSSIQQCILGFRNVHPSVSPFSE